MNALVVCHAGTGVGLGHLMRSLVAARSMRESLEVNVKILVQGDITDRHYLCGFDHEVLKAGDDLGSAIAEQARVLNAHIVVFDLYPAKIPADFETVLGELRSRGLKLVGIDGLFEYHEKLNLIFVPSFNYSPASGFSTDTPVLFGWDCYLLNVNREAPKWQSGDRILVLTGGSDATNLGETLPAVLDAELPAGTEVNWVVGPFAREPFWPEHPGIKISKHRSLPVLSELMIRSNYALSLYGVSFFELLYYGIPTVVFSPYGSQHDAELEVIENEGLALVASDENDAVKKLEELMTNISLATSLSERARNKMIVPGGQKFSDAIAKLVM